VKEVIRISTEEFRSKLSHYAGKVKYGNKEIIVECRKKPSFKVVSIEENKDNE
jgi:hypothetical protein